MSSRRLAAAKPVNHFFIVALLGTTGVAQPPAAWQDPSRHQVRFVTVEKDVRLEVLDWGGEGPNIVLLAGSGNTGHVFDEVASLLRSNGHVYGITRRGFGASTHTETGYDDQRLADDVLHVLDGMRIMKPILVGHSLAGSEMTTLGSQHSDRLSGLVYLDAGDDPGDYPGVPAYRALFDQLPATVARPDRGGPDDKLSFDAYRAFQRRTTHFAFPESELRQMFVANPDGSVGALRPRGPASKPVQQAIGEGSKKRDYTKIRVPILYLPAAPPRAGGWSQYYRFTPSNESERTTLQKIYDADRANLTRYELAMKTAQAKVYIVELRGADHYVYFTNQPEVLREIRKFTRKVQ